MADNITAPAAASVFATDEIGGVHYPRQKISIGADGAASDVSSANPLPVDLSAASLAALETTELGATSLAALENITATVTGSATAANQTTQTAAIESLASATTWFAITPADSALATVPDAVYVGGAGTVVARGSNATDATFTVAAGAILPIRPTQIRAASTATGIVGLVN